jgi:hypothetical protein
MSSPPRSREREAQRHLSVRTLAIASVASATAAIVVSQFWAGGTPIAAAVTPVLVALVSEMLHRPTEAIARRVTTDRTAILPAVKEDEPRPQEPRRESGTEPPVRVYGRAQPPRPRRKIAVGVVVTTAVLAFAIAAAALTVPELIAGRSIVKGDRNTTLVPTKRKKSKSSEQQQQTPTTPEQQTTTTTPEKKPQATTTTPTQTETTPTQTQTTRTTPPK